MRLNPGVFIAVTLLALALPISARADDKPSLDAGVLCGIDVLVRDDFAQLAGRHVGLITNHTGLDRDGRSTLTLLHDAPNVELVALFAPEHGIEGKIDAHVPDATDSLTGLRVHSLYGETRRPTAEMLAGVDTIVFDIQDIGTRFYTYIATMGMAMEEAAKHNIRFVVLDRPNPITGTRVFGPFNDEEGRFTAYHRIPLVHGMTVGELARMFNAERKIGADLQVIKMEGWRRSMWLDETLLTWVDPSPNMRSLTEATLYPAIGMIEACDVSVGRGTDTPFERVGAPWIDGRRLAARMNSLGLKGVRFLPYRFTPTSSKHANTECGGVQIILTDRTTFDPAETGLALARELRKLFGDSFDAKNVNRLLFNEKVVDRVMRPMSDRTRAAAEGDGDTNAAEERVRRQAGQLFTPLWADDLQDFRARRVQFLLYD